MRQQIVDLINERGEMTFRELCCELNMFSTEELQDVQKRVYGMVRSGDLIQIGECNIHNSTILTKGFSCTTEPATVAINPTACKWWR